MNMKTLILAGGFGTRLAHISGGKPKPLMDIAGKPILERQINFLLSHGMDDIRLSLHHKADQIIEFCERNWPKRFEYIIEPTPLGTGGGIRFASKDISNPFLVVNADILSDINVAEFASQTPNAIVGAYQEDARPYGLLDIKNGKIAAFREKPAEKCGGYINAGFYLLHPDVFSHISAEAFMIEKEIFPQLAGSGRLNVFTHNGYWIDCGTEERLAQAHHDHKNESHDTAP